ncbi:S8 family serine peptidase [Williamsia sp.]|uniref:S8 family serine peptidase n=1 Tax=Williamsia sp. TaxID=1872085 RepID=UPI001A1C004E|nr:S8 family serine peptidase [Williamsia sp.]MBJ7288771.1 S8 family serine peptidase [Williamsia sp.]
MIGGNQGTGEGATGRRIVVFAPGDGNASYASTLRQVAGMTSVASTTDFVGQALDIEQTRSAQATIFAELGVAVVDADADQAVALDAMCSEDGAIRSIEPERVQRIRTNEPPATSADYLRGYRDGVTDLSQRLGGTTTSAAAAGPIIDTDQFTWGLIATGVSTSGATGAGVKVAVLDTGFDLTHPDFVGRSITAQSFVSGEQPQDGHGHGTHCVGTSCGPLAPPTGRRYGIAHGAEIYVGKVLGNDGGGPDAGILAGLNWALANGVQIVSMSLGADVREVSKAYETVGRRALDAGTLIVAAAGNNADRPSDPGFVGVPANSPSIAAVGAVDGSLAIAPFSARSTAVDGGDVDIAAPGVDVYSSWPVSDTAPSRYNTISGTSMATPHVAGIAALWCQTTGRRGRDLWTTLTQEARRLDIPAADVGSGLVIAPR